MPRASVAAGGCTAALCLTLAGWLLASSPEASGPVASPPAPRPPAEAESASSGIRDGAPSGTAEVPATGRVAVGYHGRPAPGLQLTLSAAAGQEDGRAFRWIQTRGPMVALDDPTAASPRFIVPDRAGLLEFVLVVANGEKASTHVLTIPVEGPHAGVDLRADAGDDQIAVVGRRVTLNGLRSEPAGRIGFRWVQVAGPAATLPVEDGSTYSFVAAEPGLYRFALVVAQGVSISAPDHVEVQVGTLSPAPAPSQPSQPPPPAPPPTVAQFARSALASIDGGTAAASELASAFEATADRADLYGTYTDLYSELSRRVESILPADPAQRRAWETALFAPLTAQLVAEMGRGGIDLRTAEGLAAPLPDDLRRRLALQFREMASGFRQLSADGADPEPR